MYASAAVKLCAQGQWAHKAEPAAARVVDEPVRHGEQPVADGGDDGEPAGVLDASEAGSTSGRGRSLRRAGRG